MLSRSTPRDTKNANGNGNWYVYGFRVPLLVVSAYANQKYISGSLKTNPGGENPPFIHDFGSILGYVEYVFGLNAQFPSGIAGNQDCQYADYFAPDSQTGGCPPTTCPYPLSSFFGTAYRTFVPITGAIYPSSCFQNPKSPSCFGNNYPSDPDDDGVYLQD
jgi:hypothetical protein